MPLQCCFVSVAPLALSSFPKQTNTHTNKANQRGTIVWKKVTYGTALTMEIGEFFLAFTTTEKGENERFLVLVPVPSATFALCCFLLPRNKQNVSGNSIPWVLRSERHFFVRHYNTMMIWFLIIFWILYLVTYSCGRINNVWILSQFNHSVMVILNPLSHEGSRFKKAEVICVLIPFTKNTVPNIIDTSSVLTPTLVEDGLGSISGIVKHKTNGRNICYRYC